MRAGRIAPGRKARLEMMPLMDAVFILLIFFLYAVLRMTIDRGVWVDLPEAPGGGSSGPAGEHAVVVGITAEGETYFNRERIPAEALHDRILAEKQSVPGDLTIFLRGDRRAYHEQTVKALDSILRAGAGRVFFEIAGE